MKRLQQVPDNSPAAINTANAVNFAHVMRWSDPIRITTRIGPFTIQHGLGLIPDFMIYMRNTNVAVYVTDANRGAWTATQVELTGAGAGTVTVLLGTLR